MPLNIPIPLLRNFLAIVNLGSMARAAEGVHLSQSALSLQMKRLSELIGDPIFERQGGRRSLTPLGERLLSYAKEIIAVHDRMVTEFDSDVMAPVRIGLTPVIADVFLDIFLREISARIPKARLRINIEHSADLCSSLETDDLDLAVYFNQIPDVTTIAQSRHHWFGNPELLNLPELPVAVMSRPSTFRDLVVNALEAMGLPYEITLSSASVPALVAAVRSGIAITYLPAEFFKNELSPLPIADFGAASVSYHVRIGGRATDGAHRVAELITKIIKDILLDPDLFQMDKYSLDNMVD